VDWLRHRQRRDGREGEDTLPTPHCRPYGTATRRALGVRLRTQGLEHEIPEQDKLPFAKTITARWGAVDGSNDYADCDTAVIFGLPFRDAVTWPTNVFFALQCVQGDDWLDNPTWKGQVNMRELMVRRQLSASIIQAINRIRCRHVTEARGGCAAFLFKLRIHKSSQRGPIRKNRIIASFSVRSNTRLWRHC
jgi:hypothetical protein